MKSIISHYWGLFVLIPFLLIIVLTNVYPGQFAAGWDNFSVSLNLKTNLPRTIFATWRAYRGLGVPSDSEVVDVFRQLFYLLISWLPVRLIDQIYLMLTLITGITGIYFLVILMTTKNNHPSNFSNNLAALLSSLLFLFSFNTVATYFFPLPMYIARFAFFPWVIYSFINYLTKPNSTKLLLFAVISLIASGSYLTATVFVTLVFGLSLISLFFLKNNFRKILTLAVIFLLTNSFWLLPFTDYTLRKSSLIPLASSFADINENQLNENPHHFDWRYLITGYPNFLYVESATDLKTKENISLHSQATKLNPFLHQNWPLYTLIFLGLIGFIPCFFSKKILKAGFIPVIIIGCLMMIRKEYPPLGSIYDWLGSHLPYFKIIFRFGDTKFNSLIFLFWSLSAGIAIHWMVELKKSKVYQFLITVSLVLITFFTIKHFAFIAAGQLTSNLTRTDIPSAYLEIANFINQDPQSGRVLHLPYDRLSYFKAHSWGYFGSTFMAFLLDHPLLDRAFAPASLENDQVDLQIFKLAQNAAQLSEKKSAANLAAQFHQLLASTNTKYLIHDQTVSITNQEDLIGLWGEFSPDNFSALVSIATQAGVLTPIKSYFFNNLKLNNTLALYQVVTPTLTTQTLKQATAISDGQENVLSLALSTNTPLYQSAAMTGLFYPFYQSSLIYEDHGNTLKAKLNQSISAEEIISNSESQSHNYQIFVALQGSDLVVTLEPQPYPFKTSISPTKETFLVPLTEIASYFKSNDSLENYAADWHILPFQQASKLRINIDGTIIPLPAELPTTDQYLATVTVNNLPFSLSILAPQKSTQLDPTNFVFTHNPNCFQDKSANYAYDLKKDSQQLTLSTTNGTTCITQILPARTTNSPYLEINLDYQLAVTNKESDSIINSPSRQQQQILTQFNQLPTANYFSACLINSDSEHCLNNHHTFNYHGKNLTLVTSQQSTALNQLFISLPTIGQQTVTLTLDSLELTDYQSIAATRIQPKPHQAVAKISGAIDSIELTKTLSPESYYFNPHLDAFRVFNEPYSKPDQFRTVKTQNSQTLLYAHNFSSGAYTILPYNPHHSYLWQVNYHLYAGKYPLFLLASNTNRYWQSYLSWNQGYSEISEFKNLQSADRLFWNNQDWEKYLTDQLEQDTFRSTSVIIPPNSGLNELTSLSYLITQNSPNQGLFGITNFNLLQIPTHWQNLALKLAAATTDFTMATVDEKPTFLPSLWQLKIEPALNSATNQPLLLHFSQGYDDKWQIYQTSSPILALLGFGRIKAEHVKINGLTNGWIFSPPETSTNYYVFYTPERLAISGWLLTIATMIFLLVRCFRKPKLTAN